MVNSRSGIEQLAIGREYLVDASGCLWVGDQLRYPVNAAHPTTSGNPAKGMVQMQYVDQLHHGETLIRARPAPLVDGSPTDPRDLAWRDRISQENRVHF